MARLLILVAGESASGKTASIMGLTDPTHEDDKGVFYLNTEANKAPPFPEKFKKLTDGLDDSKDVFSIFDSVESMDDIHTIVIDSITFLMDRFESQHVLTLKDQRGGWSGYQQFFKSIMQTKVAPSKKNWVFLAHNAEEQIPDGETVITKYYVPVKGALKNQGLEAYFNIIVYTRVLKVSELEAQEYDPELLCITEEDRRVGYKHVYQCAITSDMCNSRIRSPLGCFSAKQIFMDNNIRKLINHLENYYGIGN